MIADHDVTEPSKVVIDIETELGLWVQALGSGGYQVFAVNPLAVARYRERHQVSGAKSDACDAKVLADLVRTDRHNHRSLARDSPELEAIKVLSRAHQKLVRARTRHTKALRSALREYYPAELEAFDDLHDRDALAVLGPAPTPAEAAHLSLSKIRSALKHGGRKRNLGARAGVTNHVWTYRYIAALLDWDAGLVGGLATIINGHAADRPVNQRGWSVSRSETAGGRRD